MASIDRFASTLNILLRNSQDKFGGRIVLTFPCGERVHKLLKANGGEWKAGPYHDVAKYDFSVEEAPVGARYATRLPFTNGALYEEPLVPTSLLKKTLVKVGFTLTMFISLADHAHTKCTDERKAKLTAEDWAHLEKYVMLVADMRPARKVTKGF